MLFIAWISAEPSWHSVPGGRSAKQRSSYSHRPAYLRIHDAAVYCSCSAEYLAKCVRKAQLSFIKKGRCVFFAVADLDCGCWLIERKPRDVVAYIRMVFRKRKHSPMAQ